MRKPQCSRKMRSNQLVAILIITVTACLLIISLKPHEQVYVYMKNNAESMGISNIAPSDPVRKIYQAWKKCMVDKTASFKGDHKQTWSKIGAIVRECEQPYVKLLNVKDYSNSDETKRHILPITKNESDPTVVITLGIGHDTRAEEKLLAEMGNKSVQFFGADPMHEINEDLYTKFGKYFPFAVSGKPGFSVANVLQGNSYKDKVVVHVDAVYFLTKLVGLTFFDTIWMDAEGAEYELFSFINKDGDFDQNDITVCQMNLEIHMPDDKKKKLTHDFLFQTLDDERYGFFLPVQANHLRLFFVNFENPRCIEKYFPKFSDLSNFTAPVV